MTNKPTSCAVCKKDLAGHYRVTAIDLNGVEKGNVETCSIYCLVQWAYGFTARTGARGAMMVQAAAKDPDILKKLLKGLVDKL